LLPFLTAVELFQGISGVEAHKIAALCSERSYPQGTPVFSEGDASNSVLILRKGRVKLISVSEKGMQTILHILKPGHVFGELFLAQGKRPFTAIAIEDVVVTIVPRETLLALFSSVPTIALSFVRLLSKRLMKVEKELAEFGHTWSYNRLARVLLDLCEEHGKETQIGTQIELRLTHEDLANLIGTTRETVTVQLNKFKRMGILRRRERHMVVNRPRLTDFMRL
jgi:CRP/FNR family cyclic AMP-dependent transcriptional regulator